MRPSAKVSYDNQDRVVLVTGGASGIGASIVSAFAGSGAHVICADLREPDPLPKKVHFQKCDVAKEADCRNAVDFAASEFGGLDVLVNNAAVQPKESYHALHDLSSEVWHQMVNVNLGGYHHTARFALGQMQKQKSGVVVNISSGQAHRTARQVGIYGPIKSANIMQARQWAVEYARDGIRVVSVSPGAIDTPLVRATLEQQGGGEALANRHPLGRIGKPEEVAWTVLWLSSDDASFITGTDLEVDGGLGAFGAFADPY